jgi:phosphatidylethanolamine/phosphatidyl-N-methylethanolamine N-methyltransferase
LNAVLEGTSLQIARKQRVNPLRFWALVECVNGKDNQTNGTAAAHPVAGYVNGNGAATFANGNGNGRYSPEHAH